MAWFKKSPEEDDEMSNPDATARAPASEPLTSRPEPREPREARDLRDSRELREPREPLDLPEPREPRQPRVGPRAEPRTDTRPPNAVAAARSSEARAGEPAQRVSVLGPSLRFRGELSAQEDLIVQGTIEGSITHTQTLTIGTDGSMKGDIRARIILIDGIVDGNLYATESVTIRATARVRGNVFSSRIAIVDGAFFQGQVEMQSSGAAVQEHSARLRQAAQSAPIDRPSVDPMMNNT